MKPEELIAAIRASFIGAEQVYMNGSCVAFYLVLKTAYADATPYWSHDAKHMITKIGDDYYDITGKLESIEGYVLEENKWGSIPVAVAFPEKKEQKIRFAVSKKLC